VTTRFSGGPAEVVVVVDGWVDVVVVLPVVVVLLDAPELPVVVLDFDADECELG
jgi:hypothetical protein